MKTKAGAVPVIKRFQESICREKLSVLIRNVYITIIRSCYVFCLLLIRCGPFGLKRIDFEF